MTANPRQAGRENDSEMSLASEPQAQGASWWQRRTRVERRISLLATVFLFVAIGLAIAMASLIYRVNTQERHGVAAQDDATPSAAAFTSSLGLEPNFPSPASISAELAAKGNPFSDPVCDTPGCVLAAAELLKNMDPTVDPCDDFYAFACGGFEKKTVIPDDQSSVTTFSQISDRVTEQLRQLIERPLADDEEPHNRLVKNLYASCLNKTRAEELGLTPLREILRDFGGWPVVDGDDWNEDNFVWYRTIYDFRRVGYSIDYLIDFSITTDLKNSSFRVIDLDQGTLGMPGREYLLKGLGDKDVKAYLEYQIGLATLLGADKDRARKELVQIVEFEIALANISMSREARRNVTALYNPMTIAELAEMVPDVPWLSYINKVLHPLYEVTDKERVIVDTPNYFKNLTILLANTPKRTVANYLMWRISAASVGSLNEAARALQLKYSAALTGTTERKPRWEECTDLVSGSLGNAVGAMYVKEYFHEDSKKTALEMVNDFRAVFAEMLDENEWMDPDTKERAKDKAASMTPHIGYPDELLDRTKLTNLYDKLEMGTTDYLRNALNLTVFGTNYSFRKLRQRVNKTDWVTHGRPAVVNAFYSPLENSIQFPAGILQGAFFGKERPAYLNYAAIGWVIGHEITHGFDDQGRQFGPDGNLVEWWAPSTKQAYLERAQCIINQYGNYTVPEANLNLNGFNTQGENIADNGGIKEAYRAYIKYATRQRRSFENWDQVEARLPGLAQYSVRQLFWIGAANVWCSKLRPETYKLRILTGAHSPSRYRVRGPFANMPQFATDFRCPLGKKMNPVDKCAVW